VIDEETLTKLIEAGEIGGAASTCSSTSRGVKSETGYGGQAGKVTLLPHMGSATIEGRDRDGRRRYHQHQNLPRQSQAAGPRGCPACCEGLSTEGPHPALPRKRRESHMDFHMRDLINESSLANAGDPKP